MKLYESEEQMMAWDFIENKRIDIIEEDANIDQEIAYICPKCQENYKEKVNAWSKKQCEKCRKNYRTNYLSGKWKYRCYVHEFLNIFFLFVFNIFVSSITLELDKFDLQFGYMTVCYMVFLFGAYMLLRKYFQLRLLKNPNYQRYCLTTFLLLKQEDIFSLSKEINLSLAGLLKPYLLDGRSNEEIVYMLKTDKHFCKSSRDKREIKRLGKLIRNDVYYNEVVSDFETKDMINFKSEGKIINTFLELLITFIGIFLTIVNYISDWERFGLKSLTVFAGLVVLYFTIMIHLNKWQKDNKVETTRTRLIVISSAIAKKYNQNTKSMTK